MSLLILFSSSFPVILYGFFFLFVKICFGTLTIKKIIINKILAFTYYWSGTILQFVNSLLCIISLKLVSNIYFHVRLKDSLNPKTKESWKTGNCLFSQAILRSLLDSNYNSVRLCDSYKKCLELHYFEEIYSCQFICTYIMVSVLNDLNILFLFF